VSEPELSLMGVYGPWVSGRASIKNREFSFLDERWSDASIWSGQAKAHFAASVLSQDLGTPKAEITGSRTFDGLIVEELAWKLPYGPPTRAFFLKPEDAKEPLPGILALHDHGSNKYFGKRKIADATGKLHPFLDAYRNLYYGGRAWANELAKRGYGVLIHDVFPFGSRRLLASELPRFVVERMMRSPEALREPSPESARSGPSTAEYDVVHDESIPEIERYNAFAGQYESTIAKSLFCAGLTWPGVVLSEDRAALEYLVSRPDIDSDRIGCGGLSGGGLRTNYLAGTDSRIRCSVTAGFMTTWADFALHSAYAHTWMVYIPGLPQIMDYPDILAMRAPLPALVLATRNDPLFSLEDVRKAEDELRAIYRKTGAGDRFRMSYYDGPHQFDVAMQDEAFDWFDRWLKAH
jgi:dienelactone hydrolase